MGYGMAGETQERSLQVFSQIEMGHLGLRSHEGCHPTSLHLCPFHSAVHKANLVTEIDSVPRESIHFIKVNRIIACLELFKCNYVWHALFETLCCVCFGFGIYLEEPVNSNFKTLVSP